MTKEYIVRVVELSTQDSAQIRVTKSVREALNKIAIISVITIKEIDIDNEFADLL